MNEVTGWGLAFLHPSHSIIYGSPNIFSTTFLLTIGNIYSKDCLKEEFIYNHLKKQQVKIAVVGFKEDRIWLTSMLLSLFLILFIHVYLLNSLHLKHCKHFKK